MNTKAEKYNKFLTENNIPYFHPEEVAGNDMHAVVYRSAMEVKGQNLPTMLVIDDSIFVMLQVRVCAGLVKENNKNAVMAYLNTMNETYKVFKYYATEGGDIVIESCIPTTDDAFTPEMVQAVIKVVVDHLEEKYPELMKAIWG